MLPASALGILHPLPLLLGIHSYAPFQFSQRGRITPPRKESISSSNFPPPHQIENLPLCLQTEEADLSLFPCRLFTSSPAPYHDESMPHVSPSPAMQAPENTKGKLFPSLSIIFPPFFRQNAASFPGFSSPFPFQIRIFPPKSIKKGLSQMGQPLI